MTENDIKRLNEMQNVDIRTIDSNLLVDINEVNVNTKLPLEDRINEFLRQIKNPYCYKCGKIVVKISFSDSGYTLEDRMKSFLLSF